MIDKQTVLRAIQAAQAAGWRVKGGGWCNPTDRTACPMACIAIANEDNPLGDFELKRWNLSEIAAEILQESQFVIQAFTEGFDGCKPFWTKPEHTNAYNLGEEIRKEMIK